MSYSPFFRGSQGKGSGRSTCTNFQNGTIGTLLPGTPVCINASSQLVFLDMTDQASVQNLVGLVTSRIPIGAIGPVTDNGRLENITMPFSIGDALYINYDNTLTTTKPDLAQPGFVPGMFCIFIGVVVKNEFDPLLKDIKLMISVIGEL
jgi:hypothetical protein